MIKGRDEATYRMCGGCADHNVKNRGAEDMGPYEGPAAGAAEPDYSQYEADAVETVDADNILAKITRTVRDLTEARSDVEQAEEALKNAQKRARTIEEFTLPELMREAGQTKLKTVDGVEVELTETLRASIPVANQLPAFNWLVEHNQGAIIKRDLRLQFGKNEGDKADRALAVILEAGFTPQDKQSVHPQTLAATIRELMEAGVDVPLELLGAHVQAGIKLKAPKG